MCWLSWFSRCFPWRLNTQNHHTHCTKGFVHLWCHNALSSTAQQKNRQIWLHCVSVIKRSTRIKYLWHYWEIFAGGLSSWTVGPPLRLSTANKKSLCEKKGVHKLFPNVDRVLLTNAKLTLEPPIKFSLSRTWKYLLPMKITFFLFFQIFIFNKLIDFL